MQHLHKEKEYKFKSLVQLATNWTPSIWDNELAKEITQASKLIGKSSPTSKCVISPLNSW
jgi:hypothetical protein